MNPPQYTIVTDTLQKVFNYLGKRPYVEVVDLINEIQRNSAAVVEPKIVTPVETPKSPPPTEVKKK